VLQWTVCDELEATATGGTETRECQNDGQDQHSWVERHVIGLTAALQSQNCETATLTIIWKHSPLPLYVYNYPDSTIPSIR